MVNCNSAVVVSIESDENHPEAIFPAPKKLNASVLKGGPGQGTIISTTE